MQCECFGGDSMDSTPFAFHIKKPLLSGEVHYFRLHPSEWRVRLAKAKEAGLDAVSTYIPWNWHEAEPGVFDFSGDSHPQRNIELFLELAEEENVYVIAKPGPYICAEWIYGGIPRWLLQAHPEILARNSSGRPTRWFSKKAPAITYLHPLYLAYAKRWMKVASQIIKKHQMPNGGCIIAVQIDNESSYGFHFLPFETDYNPVVIGSGENEGLYHEWLRSNFDSINQLNEAYGTCYTDFSEVTPPRRFKGRRDLPAMIGWLSFKEDMISEFLRQIAGVVRGEGVSTLLLTNEFFNPFLYPPVQTKSKLLVDAVNLYPHYLDEASFLAVVNYLDFFRLSQPDAPLLVSELQSGWFSSKVSDNTLHILERIAYVKGAEGINFYMFSGGINPSNFGTTGRKYFQDAPLNVNGEETGKYHVIKGFASMVKLLGVLSPLLDLHVGYYHPYSLAELSGGYDVFGRKYRGITTAFRNLLLHLLKSGLGCAPLPLKLAVSSSSIPLIFCAFDFLGKSEAASLLDYVKRGGSLILMPQTPMLDEFLHENSILVDAIKIKGQSVKSGVLSFGQHIIKGRRVTVFEVDEAEPLAVLKTGEICGFKLHIGKGVLIQLGFIPHGKAAINLVKLIPKKPVCEAENMLALPSKGENGFYLLACNLRRSWAKGNVQLNLPECVVSLRDIPLPARSACIWPIKRKVDDAELLYATAELIREDHNVLTFRSYEGLTGQIAIKLPEEPELLPERSRWDPKTRILILNYGPVSEGENIVLEEPLRISVIGVRRPSLETIKERFPYQVRRWFFRKILGY
ncbi:MAG: beta-galactosidase [Candidatus Freyarchaeota archaeon]